jgi:hypothetical protein
MGLRAMLLVVSLLTLFAGSLSQQHMAAATTPPATPATPGDETTLSTTVLTLEPLD